MRNLVLSWLVVMVVPVCAAPTSLFFWENIQSLTEYDTALSVSGSPERILLNYSNLGHQLVVESNRLSAIIPNNIDRQKNGYEILLKWHKKGFKYPDMIRQYYSNDSLIPEKEIILKKRVKSLEQIQDTVYTSFNEYAFNDSLNNCYERRFLITWTYNAIRVIGSNGKRILYLQFENGWIRAAGIILEFNREPDGPFYFYERGRLLFTLNFSNGEMTGSQKYFTGKTEYNFSYEQGEFVDSDEEMKDTKIFESYFSRLEKVLFDIDQIPFQVASRN